MVSREQFDRLVGAWNLAARDLRVIVHAPFEYEVGGRRHTAVAHLPDFGGTRGAVVLVADDDSFGSALHDATALGYWVSRISVEPYSAYQREHFLETLDDWGYFGAPEGRPTWCTGRPWTP